MGSATPCGPMRWPRLALALPWQITLWRREVSPERTSSAWVGTHTGDQSGSDRRQARLRRRAVRLFSPLGGLKPPVLEIEEGDQAHQRMPMQPGPGAPFEVVEPQLLLEAASSRL